MGLGLTFLEEKVFIMHIASYSMVEGPCDRSLYCCWTRKFQTACLRCFWERLKLQLDHGVNRGLLSWPFGLIRWPFRQHLGVIGGVPPPDTGGSGALERCHRNKNFLRPPQRMRYYGKLYG